MKKKSYRSTPVAAITAPIRAKHIALARACLDEYMAFHASDAERFLPSLLKNITSIHDKIKTGSRTVAILATADIIRTVLLNSETIIPAPIVVTILFGSTGLALNSTPGENFILNYMNVANGVLQIDGINDFDKRPILTALAVGRCFVQATADQITAEIGSSTLVNNAVNISGGKGDVRFVIRAIGEAGDSMTIPLNEALEKAGRTPYEIKQITKALRKIYEKIATLGMQQSVEQADIYASQSSKLIATIQQRAKELGLEDILEKYNPDIRSTLIKRMTTQSTTPTPEG